MFALISPNEPAATGFRVAQVEAEAFEVAQPLFWVEVQGDVDAAAVFYDPISQALQALPAPPVDVPPSV